MTEIVTDDGVLVQDNLVSDARKFQKHVLLRTYDENGGIDATCFKASNIIDALIDRVEVSDFEIRRLREQGDTALTDEVMRSAQENTKGLCDEALAELIGDDDD